MEELTAEVARLVAKYHNERAEGGRSFEFHVGAYPKIKGKDKDQRRNAKEPS